jgi:hypothetical protein
LGFLIERSLNGTNFVVVGTNAPGIHGFDDVGLLSDTTHYYRVRTYSGTGASPYTLIAQATTLAGGGVAGYLQDSGPDGLVVIEAEGFDANVAQGGKSQLHQDRPSPRLGSRNWS